MKKRIFALLLVLCLALTLLPSAAFAADIVDSGFCGMGSDGLGSGNMKWTLDSNGVLTISGTGTMMNYGTFSQPYPDWAFSSISIKTVIVTDGVDTIGNHAFSALPHLTKVELPDSIKIIGESAFQNCQQLTDIRIGENVEEIRSLAFEGSGYFNDESNWQNGVLYLCNHLIAAKKDIESCTIKSGTRCIADQAFMNCKALTSVTIPDSVTTIGSHAFFSTALTSVTIPKSVKEIGDYAFAILHDFNAVNITDLKAWTEILFAGRDANPLMFAHNLYLNGELVTDLVLPDGITSTGDQAFFGCQSIQSIVIPGSANRIEFESFRYCAGVTHVTIQEGVTEIGDEAFYGCKNMRYITIPASVKRIEGWVFDECDNLKDIYYGGDQAQWDAILISPSGNLSLPNATIHFNRTGPKPIELFDDTPSEGNWAYPGIDYCLNTGLIVGTSETTFSPEEALTRGQFVTILWRQLGCPAPQGANPFTDLTMDYYKDAITWAAENKVVYGRSATTFDPDCAITRQELTTMFYRYVGGYLKQDVSGAADIRTFPDYSSVADYAQAAMAWAKGVGLITGNEIGGTIYLDPLGAATRAQAATMFMNLCEKVLK